MLTFIKRVLKFIFILIGIIIGGLVISLIVYYLFGFKPYCPEIESIIRDTPSWYKQPSQELVDIAKFIEGSKIKHFTVKTILVHFEKDRRGNLRWHVEGVLWRLLMELYFDDRDIFALWCHFFPYENGTGLNESARFYYGKDIDELNFKEIVSIIARVRSPGYYKIHPEKLEERINHLLETYSSFGTS